VQEEATRCGGRARGSAKNARWVVGGRFLDAEANKEKGETCGRWREHVREAIFLSHFANSRRTASGHGARGVAGALNFLARVVSCSEAFRCGWERQVQLVGSISYSGLHCSRVRCSFGEDGKDQHSASERPSVYTLMQNDCRAVYP